MLDVVERPVEPRLGDCRRIGDMSELGQQAFLHAEHRIRMDIGIVGVEDMRDERLVARCLEDVVQVRRAIGMAAQSLASSWPTGPSSGIG